MKVFFPSLCLCDCHSSLKGLPTSCQLKDKWSRCHSDLSTQHESSFKGPWARWIEVAELKVKQWIQQLKWVKSIHTECLASSSAVIRQRTVWLCPPSRFELHQSTHPLASCVCTHTCMQHMQPFCTELQASKALVCVNKYFLELWQEA